MFFCLPDDSTQDSHFQNKITKCLPYLILTDTDIASFLFVFVCQLKFAITETRAKELTFKIALDSKIRERLDLSDDFYAQFTAQDKIFKKQVGLYEIEAIENHSCGKKVSGEI